MKESINRELLKCRKETFRFSVVVIALSEEIDAKLLVWCSVLTMCSINSCYHYRSEWKKDSTKLSQVCNVTCEHKCGHTQDWGHPKVHTQWIVIDLQFSLVSIFSTKNVYYAKAGTGSNPFG